MTKDIPNPAMWVVCCSADGACRYGKVCMLQLQAPELPSASFPTGWVADPMVDPMHGECSTVLPSSGCAILDLGRLLSLHFASC
jgi:hypothetical protein